MSSTEPAAPRSVGVHFSGDLRAALIAAAADAVNDEGLEKLSLRSVARRVGVSHAAPAHHFRDKAGLLTALAAEGFHLLTACLIERRDQAPDGTTGQLIALGRAYSEFAGRYPGHFDIMFRPAVIRMDDPALSAASEDAYGVLAGCVRVAQEHGWHADADPAALTAASWALAHGFARLTVDGALQRHQPAATPQLTEKILEALLKP